MGLPGQGNVFAPSLAVAQKRVVLLSRSSWRGSRICRRRPRPAEEHRFYQFVCLLAGRSFPQNVGRGFCG